MKKLLTLLLIMLLPFGLVSSETFADGINDKAGSASILDALNKVGSEIFELHISGWAKINDKYMDLSSLRNLAQNSAKFLGSCAPYEVQSLENETVRQIKYKISMEDAELQITLNNGYSPYDEIRNYETYIVVNTVLDEKYQDLKDFIYEKVSNFLHRFSDNPYISETCLAAIQGNIKRKVMDKISRQIFREMQGNIIEEMKDERLISRTGYSHLLDGYLISRDRKINLNVSLRYNESEDMTYIWVGTPVITTVY